VVYHACSSKHVTRWNTNPKEAIKNKFFETKNMAVKLKATG